jgi:glutamine synthetase type III
MQTQFEDRLFEMVTALFPELTVRRFSQMLGKSDGYWSSIKAQDLTLSTSALVNLRDTLEARKILISKCGTMNERVEQIQVLIQDELINRFEAATEIALTADNDNIAVEDYDVLPMIYQFA